MDILKTAISSRLKQYIGENFKSVSDFAKQMGLKRRQDVYPYLEGKSLFGADKLAKLHALGCNINWLLAGDVESVVDESQETYSTRDVTQTNTDGKHMQIASINGKTINLSGQQRDNDFLLANFKLIIDEKNSIIEDLKLEISTLKILVEKLSKYKRSPKPK